VKIIAGSISSLAEPGMTYTKEDRVIWPSMILILLVGKKSRRNIVKAKLS
jgi:hypothetical protein